MKRPHRTNLFLDKVMEGRVIILYKTMQTLFLLLRIKLSKSPLKNYKFNKEMHKLSETNQRLSSMSHINLRQWSKTKILSVKVARTKTKSCKKKKTQKWKSSRSLWMSLWRNLLTRENFIMTSRSIGRSVPSVAYNLFTFSFVMLKNTGKTRCVSWPCSSFPACLFS